MTMKDVATTDSAKVDSESRERDQEETTVKKEKPEEEEIITIVPSIKKMAISPASPSQSNSPLLSSLPSSSTKTTRKPQPPPLKPKPLLSPTQISTETTLRTTTLTRLLRHSLLHSLSHLSTSTPNSPASTTSIPLTTFLLSQMGPIITQMQIYACIHLQILIPLLCGIIRDPFATTAAPEMFSVTIDAVEGLVSVCWVRIKEKWWLEILGGVVEGWLNLRDDIEGMKGERKRVLEALMERLEVVVTLLGDVVGREEFGKVVERLVKEKEELSGLFDGWNADGE